MYIFGASGHGKVIKSILDSMKVNLTAFIDDNPKGNEFMGLPIYTSDSLNDISTQSVIIAIGDNTIRKNIAERLSVHFIKAIHARAWVDSSVKIGNGTTIMAHAVVNPDTQIGKHAIINSGAVVEHDCILEDYVHISPNATLTGGVFVGEGSHIGAGAVVLPGVRIGKWCIVGAGAVVLKDLPDHVTAVGNPARIIKVRSVDYNVDNQIIE
ncbi:MAG: acetyltransferase [Flavobacterium sp.]